MGFPPGWVTDCDIPVSAQDRCIGNAVQVQVAELVGRELGRTWEKTLAPA